MAADPLAAELAAIRERFDGAAYAKDLPKWAATIKDTGGGSEYDWMAQSLVDVPRMERALRAVLAPHEPGPVTILGALCARHKAHRHFSITAAEAADVEACEGCRATVWVSCDGCGPHVPLASCSVRRRASAELLPCTWESRLGTSTSPCTGDHSGGAHHFSDGSTLLVAETDIAARASSASAGPSGAGVDVREMLAERGLAVKDGTDDA